ncbi:MAG TPA: uroporphyrinogen decarboxylase [bacterium]|nr:uroporphyrinogen decarboxylase [bacterium]HQL62221.1 uroporphyrinogen decarboxylase [bacterium]
MLTSLTKRERFLRAIRREPVDRPPVWLMRQAGRYLPEYRAIKQHHSFSDLCRTPDLAAEVSLQPCRIFDVDGIIVFNDILIPLENMGFSVLFTETGPEVQPPLRSEEILADIHKATFDEAPPVFDTIRRIRAQAGPDVPILGFIGAPFTMAAYAVEGSMSKNFIRIKDLRFQNPNLLKRVLEIITETVLGYIRIQIDAGADIVQVFDTWAGILTFSDYREFALPYQKLIAEAVRKEGRPVILYVNGCAPYLPVIAESHIDVLSVDWRTNLRDAYDALRGRCAVQGNLDPCALFAPPETVADLTRRMIVEFSRCTGHIANLGHGILPNTRVESVHAFVETVRNYRYG